MPSRWIDVSLPLRSGMVHWPGDPAPRVERVMRLARGDLVNLTHLTMSAHTGTHVDAPRHFLDDGPAVDEMPLDALIGPARVVGIRDPRAITAAELRRHRIRRGERVLFRTRNSERPWPARPFTRRFVAVAPDAAKLLAARGVSTVGVDYLSVGVLGPEGHEVHRILGRAGICVIEGLRLAGVRPGRYDLCCLPLRIPDGDGAPARAALRPR
jgi:arylformamidase